MQDSLCEAEVFRLTAVPTITDPRLERSQMRRIDLTLNSVAWFASPGEIGPDGGERQLAKTDVLEFGSDGWLHLAPGPYLVTFNELVHVPLDTRVVIYPRSSLLRGGVTLHTAGSGSGNQSHYQGLLSVLNPRGFRVAKSAPVAEIVFLGIEKPVDGEISDP